MLFTAGAPLYRGIGDVDIPPAYQKFSASGVMVDEVQATEKLDLLLPPVHHHIRRFLDV
jgi:hypothetical protein